MLRQIDKRWGTPGATYSDVRIVCVWMWAVIHDRPVCWACRAINWLPHLRREALPSEATMSRRLRTSGVRELIKQLELRILMPAQEQPMLWFIDGKPLVIGGASRDRQASYGRAASGQAKGYKLHAVFGADYSVVAWRIAPMNTSEKVMARRLIREAPIQGYLVADANYDSNPLHDACSRHGELQLVTPRRNGRRLGHRRHSSGRLRCIAMLEQSRTGFADKLLKQCDAIERFFGRLSTWGGGLTHLPAWVRTHRRVERQVLAKLILNELKRTL